LAAGANARDKEFSQRTAAGRVAGQIAQYKQLFAARANYIRLHYKPVEDRPNKSGGKGVSSLPLAALTVPNRKRRTRIGHQKVLLRELPDKYNLGRMPQSGRLIGN
jgi:hypothetical protein